MIQGTDEWKLARAGKVTASRIADALSFVKGAEGASRVNYRLELVTERLTGQPVESFTNSYMEWGTQQEPFAREAYEKARLEFVVETGFIDHPSIPMSGASPDGLVGSDAIIEIKCPKSNTHLSYITDDKIPEKYKKQMMWQLICTGRKYCNFVSFDPRFPENLQLFIKRFEPEPEELLKLESEVAVFLATVDELETKLRNY